MIYLKIGITIIQEDMGIAFFIDQKNFQIAIEEKITILGNKLITQWLYTLKPFSH